MTALSGLTLLDFSRYLPGANVSWIAGDLGADVIRIEHPRELAKQRAMFGDAEDEARRRARPSYDRNKRSLLLNPGHPAARAVIHRLVERADVLVEDYRPGVMAGMGLGYNDLAEINPRLIYCSVTFTGQTGPLAGRAGHDPGALALADALSRLNGTPTPTLPGLPVADVLAGAHAAIGVMAALQARERTGRGQQVDVAMSDASMALLMVALGRTDDPGALPPLGAWHPKGGVWECADGRHLCTTDLEPRYWERLCVAVGRPEFVGWRTQPERWPEMYDALAAMFRTRPRDEWLALLSEAGTQAMPVLSPAEAVAHPHARARGTVAEVDAPGGAVTQIGTPFRLSGTPPVSPRPAGLAGAEGRAILAGPGLSDADVTAVERAGAFGAESAR